MVRIFILIAMLSASLLGQVYHIITPSDSIQTMAAVPQIACWGNSLTNGGSVTPYPQQLSWMSGLQTYNMGVGGETSTQIKNRMIADASKFSYLAIFWVCENNLADTTTIKTDLSQMIDSLRHDKYLVISCINNAADTLGSVTHNRVLALNAMLSRIYSNKYVDVRSYLISKYNPASPSDVYNYNKNVTPLSLRTDSIHLNATGYFYAAEKINQAITLLNQVNSYSVLTPNNLPVIFAYPPIIGRSVLNQGNFSKIGVGTFTPSQQIDLTGNIKLTNTTNANKYGYIYKGSDLVFHDFTYGNNGSVTPVGGNMFWGKSSGNQTMGATATNIVQSSNNLAFGSYCQSSLTKGYKNISFGNGSLFSITEGHSCIGIGDNALYSNLIADDCIAIGEAALFSATGYYNIAIGSNAGRYVADGTTASATASNSIYIGKSTKASIAGRNNEIVIGNDAIGNGSNTITLGNSGLVGIYTSANILVRDSLYNRSEVSAIDSSTAISLPSGVVGWGEVMCGTEWAHFRFASSGAVTLITNTANVSNTWANAKLCIYPNGLVVNIKQTLAATNTKVAIKINYYIP